MTHNNSVKDTIPARSIRTSISGQFTRHAACQSRIIDSRGIYVERKYRNHSSENVDQLDVSELLLFSLS